MTRDDKLSTFVGCLILGYCFVLTVRRNYDYRSNVSLWQATIKTSPLKSRPHYNLAEAYYQAGRYKEAEDEYELIDQLPDNSTAANTQQSFKQAAKTNLLTVRESEALSQAVGLLKEGKLIEAGEVLSKVESPSAGVLELMREIKEKTEER